MSQHYFSKSVSGVADADSGAVEIGQFEEIETTTANVTGGVTAGSLDVTENVLIGGTVEAREGIFESTTFGEVEILTNEISL